MNSYGAFFLSALLQAVWVEARRAHLDGLDSIVAATDNETESVSTAATSESDATIKASGDHAKYSEDLFVSTSNSSQIGTDLFKLNATATAPYEWVDLPFCEGQYLGYPLHNRLDNVCAQCARDGCKCYMTEPDMTTTGVGAFKMASQNKVKRALQCKGDNPARPDSPFGLGDCRADTGKMVMSKLTPCQMKGLTCYFKCFPQDSRVSYRTYAPYLQGHEFLMNGVATNEERCMTRIQKACETMIFNKKIIDPVLIHQDENYFVGRVEMEGYLGWKEPIAERIAQQLQEKEVQTVAETREKAGE